MANRQYIFKFYLNSSHSIYINGERGEVHPHTWEIAIHIAPRIEEFIQFHDVEQKIEKWIAQYQDVNLNEIEPFTKINPTLENCCEFFKDKIPEILGDEWCLLRIEMSETPTRTYVINLTDENYNNIQKYDSEWMVEQILSKMRL